MSAVDPEGMEILAWIGPDEFDGSRGIKSAHTPAGLVPLTAKGEHEDRLRSSVIRAQLQNLADRYDNRIVLARFRFVEVVETLEPD